MCTAQWGVQEMLFYKQSVSLAVLSGLLFLAVLKHFGFFSCFQVAKSRNNHVLQITS